MIATPKHPVEPSYERQKPTRSTSELLDLKATSLAPLNDCGVVASGGLS